jgi:hypothetical protein
MSNHLRRRKRPPKLFAIVSDQGTTCHELCLCERCHADAAKRAAVEKKAAGIADVPNPADWRDSTENDALRCCDCGYPKEYLWLRVGDAGDYENFGTDLDAAIEYLNELKAGEVTGWVYGGIGVGVETVNYWGYDFVSLFWGDEAGNFTAELDEEERAQVEAELEEVYA